MFLGFSIKIYLKLIFSSLNFLKIFGGGPPNPPNAQGVFHNPSSQKKYNNGNFIYEYLTCAPTLPQHTSPNSAHGYKLVIQNLRGDGLKISAKLLFYSYTLSIYFYKGCFLRLDNLIMTPKKKGTKQNLLWFYSSYKENALFSYRVQISFHTYMTSLKKLF